MPEEKGNPLLKAFIDSQLVKSEKSEKPKKNIQMDMADPFLTRGELELAEKTHNESTSLSKSFLNVLNGPGQTIERLAFEEDPDNKNQYQSIYKGKLRLLPDDILKRVSIQDSLVAAIVHARSSMLSSFGRPQPDRFSTGYRIEAEPGLFEKLNDEEKKALQKRIANAELKILSCGSTSGWKDKDACNFGSYLFMSARDAVTFGRIATEILRTGVGEDKKFHSFRPIDAGTIYKAAPYKNETQAVRKEALKILEQLRNKRLVPERYLNDEYSWVQVIHNKPRQAFTSEECLVHNFFPSTHVELNGYPITPIDTVMGDITTHININTHNKLYFQSGRAARGMIVIKSDDISKEVIGSIRQQFNASINSVSNAWRMPIFGVGQDDEITWIPIDNSSRDMEFQYLSDSNARVILSAFQMSPEELPGYTHLSRGTNNQALSESNNEYKLQAHRDVGLRPLLAHFQNFINSKILPLIDEELSKVCSFKFVGLDAETAEKEAARIGAEINIHLTMDDILEKVEKKPIGAHLGGKLILNPAYQNAIAPYLHVGYIREHIFGIKGASKDPEFAYVRDPMWFQWQQLQMQVQQMQQQQMQQSQAQAQQAQMSQQGPPPGQPQDGDGGEAQRQQFMQQQGQPDLSTGMDQASANLSKGEFQLPPSKRALLYEQKKIIQHFLDGWETDSKEIIGDIIKTAKSYVKKKE
jgi:hypothetical protein